MGGVVWDGRENRMRKEKRAQTTKVFITGHNLFVPPLSSFLLSFPYVAGRGKSVLRPRLGVAKNKRLHTLQQPATGPRSAEMKERKKGGLGKQPTPSILILDSAVNYQISWELSVPLTNIGMSCS